MTNLTLKQKSFIEYMQKSEEHARQGFELLLNGSKLEIFFDALENGGFFKPQKNPAPKPSGQEGFVQIPFWAALDYLRATARLAGERKDSELSQKVLKTIRTVSLEGQRYGSIPDNYHTCRIFSEIFGLLPSSQINTDDLGLIKIWLKGKYDRGLVAHALDKGALYGFLESESSDDWE